MSTRHRRPTSRHSTDVHRLVQDVHGVFEAAVRSVRADRLLEGIDDEAISSRLPGAGGRVVAVGMGKASMALAGALEARLGDRVDRGVVVVPEGYREAFPEGLHRPRRIEVLEARHPIPDERSVVAARRILDMARACGPGDGLIVLVSGGGSSLCTAFDGGIDLKDAQETFRLLLASGADIYAVNTVRKQLSLVGGGRLAEAAAPAEVLGLVVSDVVGDDVSMIAGGPTVLDSSSSAEALEWLSRYRLLDRVPASVRGHLEARRERPPRMASVDPVECAERVNTILLGTVREALEAAAAEAERLGYSVEIASDAVTGEAREVGKAVAQAALDRPPGCCILWGGETTVDVRGSGKGGRNQEVTLSAAIRLEGVPRMVVVFSGGSDGRDGPTDAAGAWATHETVAEARRKRIDPVDYLDRNDAYRFWMRMGEVPGAGGLVKTGPTHTNVMDVLIAITG